MSALRVYKGLVLPHMCRLCCADTLHPPVGHLPQACNRLPAPDHRHCSRQHHWQ